VNISNHKKDFQEQTCAKLQTVNIFGARWIFPSKV